MSLGDTGGSFLSENTLKRQTGIIDFCFYSQEMIINKNICWKLKNTNHCLNMCLLRRLVLNIIGQYIT